MPNRHIVSRLNKTFAIFGNKFQAEKSAYIREVLHSIAATGSSIVIEQDFADFLRRHVDISAISFTLAHHDDISADFAVSIGGDGTFLNTARLVGDRDMPIIGINTGHLGFISDILPQDANSFFRELANGNYRVEERSLLTVEADGDSIASSPFALNEIAILKHDNSSMISINTSVDGSYLATYLADGASGTPSATVSARQGQTGWHCRRVRTAPG